MPSKDSSCAGGEGQEKKEAPCPKPKSENERSKPKPSSCEREDQKCHSSQEKFKQQVECQKSKCSESKGKEKCHSSQKAFWGEKCREESKAKDCSSAKAEMPKCDDLKPKDCSSPKSEKPKCDDLRPKDCSSPKSEKPKCDDYKIKDCSSSKSEKPKCDDLKPKDCSSPKSEKPKCDKVKPKDCSRPKSEKPKCDNLKEGYIKLSDMCKTLAKQVLKQRPKSKCSSVDAADACGKGLSLPLSRPPCDPAVEAGLGPGAKSPCAPKFTGPCPEAKIPSISDFFPIDARNMKLNDCIEKYTKLDPSQVISKCSQFASQTSHLTEQCAQAVRSGQATCANAVRSSPAAQRTVRLLGPRHIQLVKRWIPTAAIYLATTALLTVYVTEWRAALRFLPFYRPPSQSQDEQEES